MAKVNWINGEIDPPEIKSYYVIIECVKNFGYIKAGEISIRTATWLGNCWNVMGRKNENFRVLSWAERLFPDIPKDLQGRVKWYFGEEVRDDGTVSQ